MAQSYGRNTGFTVQMSGPFSGNGSAGGKSKDNVTVYASAWKGATSPFSQVIEADIVTANSIVELEPNAAELGKLFAKGIALVTENNGGEVTIYALGNKPDWDLNIQISTREVVKV